MVIKKKKKKKEEFDASLMGGYLPGVRTVVNAEPVSAITKLIYSAPPFISWRWRYIPRHGPGDPGPKPAEVPMSRQFVQAWGFYGLAGVGDPKNFAEASVWSRVLGIPYIGGYIVAGSIGFFVTGLLLTVIDPLHKWEGGLDETSFYARRVTNAERKPKWGAGNNDWQRKAEAQYGWGM